MRGPSGRGVLRALVLAAVGAVGAGCESGGGDTPVTSGAAPVIANLVAGFLSQGCTTIRGQAGTVLSLALSYADPDGDLPAGRLSTTGTFAPSGISGTQDFAFSAGEATITGSTDGAIQAQPCVRFGADTAFTISVTAIDRAGNGSNTLSAQLAKPADAP